ncbi:hypothetical protein COMA1_80030 [Candidatus Nitrospira nitrosa]|uniref:Uncharacterized protein n=1 Tax=Candidatus Nitrospira nitrosa TaxID=1742972 RepID=A0A0S4LR84_9BACT|nr:hypothetical protein [Candidatus Nitrospira nitrosa]CUS39454.1 hypothetical protein COMA1_80030 [Candidatus Nitrospira nitrosa]
MGMKEDTAKALAGSFLTYLHLPSWLDQRIKSLLSGRAPVDFISISQFCRALYGEELHAGDRVRFKQAFVSEWVPRLPGELWFKDFSGQTISHKERMSGRIYKGKGYPKPEELTDIRWMASSPDRPVGVVRYPFHTDNTTFATMSLTTLDYWSCDLAVPLVVSSSVYDAFVRARQPLQAVEATIEGVLQFAAIPSLDAGMISAIGAQVDQGFLRSVVTPLDAPSVFLSIVSPLDVRFRTNDTHPSGTLWTISRRTALTKRAIRSYGGQVVDYIMEGLQFDLGKKELVDDAILHFQDSSHHPCKIIPDWPRIKDSSAPEERQVEYETLTEFDARRKLFSARVPLAPRTWERPQLRGEIVRVLGDLKEEAEPGN